MKSLTDQAFKGMVWTFFGVVSQAFFQVIVLAVLARILSPRDFGLMGIAIIVVNFINIFYELGVGPALVQREVLEERHIKVGFFMSIVFSIIFMSVVLFFTPPISLFFKMPELKNILPIIVFLFPLNGISVVAAALLNRKLKFRLLAIIDFISYFIGFGCVGIVLALCGYGLWSLISAYFVQAILRSGMFLVFNRHSVGFSIDKKTFCELMSFGAGFTIGRVANYFAVQGDNIVSGKVLGAEALGVYGRAYQLMAMPATLFGNVVDKVLFPAMSKVQNSTSHLVKSYKYSVVAATFLALPASVFCLLTAPYIVFVLLGPKWMEVSLPFQVLSFGMLFRTSYKMSESLARAKGVVYRRAWRQVVYAALVFVGAFLGVRNGVGGVAMGVVSAVIINFFLMADLSLKLLSLPWKVFWKWHLAPLRLSFVLFIGLVPIVLASDIWKIPALFTLSLCLVLFICIFLFCIKLFPKYFLGDEGIQLKQYLMEKVFKR